MLTLIYIIGALAWAAFMTFCMYVYNYRGWRMLLGGFLHGVLWPLSLTVNIIAFFILFSKRP